ncbi:peroxidase-related enzyme [Candidatus Acetothermia bacterium]|jgi:uncharacterized peroxidase-related enzyme|nr:peroxidase-related enzyme [Candidatus Acetothermia bacterium]MCI2427260.1 peroxidase-related enzyme [Candidatus Acetothermia bacterium]MCI2428534.1 peroxidase-related enzyme [Candidatus Acetothermia bacterium]
MANIKMISIQEADGPLKMIYDRIQLSRGGVANILAVHSLSPLALKAHLHLYQTLIFDPSPLSRRERELIAVAVSTSNQCEYCITHHKEHLRRLGLSEEEINAAGDDHHRLSAREQAILSFAKQLTLSPGKTEREMNALRSIGLTDREILDLTLVTAYFNFVNRIALGLGVELEDDYKTTCEPDFLFTS